LLVEPPDRVEAARALRREVDRPRRALVFGGRADHAARLVEEVIGERRELHELAVDLEALAARVDLRPELGDGLAVDRDAALLDQLLALAARADAYVGEDFMEAFYRTSPTAPAARRGSPSPARALGSPSRAPRRRR